MLLAGLALYSIFSDLGDDKVVKHLGLLTFLLYSTTDALPIFLQEHDIVAKETSSAWGPTASPPARSRSHCDGQVQPRAQHQQRAATHQAA
ncbi:unnamed protein product [Urochloa humidicola]